MDFSTRQRDQLLRIQSSMATKRSGNALTYTAYSGLRGEFTYTNGDPVTIYPVVDNEGNIIAMTWDGSLRGPIQGGFTHNGNLLGTQFVNTQSNTGVWTPFLLNYIPSECLPASGQIPQQPIPPASGPSITPGEGGAPSSPANPTNPNLPTNTIPSPEPGRELGRPSVPVPPNSVVICINGFYVAQTGINYLTTDRVYLKGYEKEFEKRGTTLIPRLDNEGRIISVDIDGDTCNLPYMPFTYVPSITGVNAKIIPIPSITPVSSIQAPGTDGKYSNADGTIVTSPVRTVYCYNH